MDLDSPQRVRRAAWVIAADIAIERADQQPVELEQTNQQVLHRAPPFCAGRLGESRETTSYQAEPKSSRTSSGTVAARGRARTTMSIRRSSPTGVSATCAAARCRRRRLTRLRVTALPTAPLTTNPMRGPDWTLGSLDPASLDPASSGACMAWTISVGLLALSPRLVVRRKSFELCILSNRGNTMGLRHGCQADRRVRPLRRRAEMIARPARVRIRRRKPWVRLRRRLLGWNVRLLTGKLHHLRGTRQSGTVLTRHASQAERAGSSRRCKRPSNGTGHRQTGQTGANSGGLRNSGRRCPVDTPNTMANIADLLASHPRDC